MLYKDFPQAFYNLFFLRYCMQEFISIQHLPSCLSYLIFSNSGMMIQVMFIFLFYLICALIFLDL